MHLNRIELTHFRNISSADLSFEGPRHFFVGPNGQGKTNILEAIALSQAVKSFRTSKREALVELGQTQAILRTHWTHEKRGQTTLGISLGSPRRQLLLDDDKLRSANEILGLFPVVALNLADRALLYGGPSARREEIDTLVSQVDPDYVRVLGDYEDALKARNRLLSADELDPSQLEAFEAIMLTTARRIIRSRQRAVELLLPLFKAAFAEFAPSGEQPDLVYAPNMAPDELAQAWESRRTTKDRMLGYTTKGPHRDGYGVLFNGQDAELYASEGQKFSIVLALKLAGLKFLRERLGIAPILVADDLLLELDGQRQQRFWASVGDLQVFASSTVAPEENVSPQWKVWNVQAGGFYS